MTEQAAALSPVPVLVSDFDGTMTQRDFFTLALARLVPPGIPDYWSEFLAGRMTHFEALQRIFSHIRADEAEVMATAQLMGLDPGLHTAVERMQNAGWQIVVASAGCDWYIRRLLSSQQVEITVHSNPGELDPARGLLMSLPTASPFCSTATGIDKAAVVRDAVKTHACVAFAGDGRPDLPAAMLVPPERRFARGWLAEHFRTQGLPFHAFECWSEIAEILLKGDDVC